MKIGKIYIQPHPIAVHFTNALFPVSLLFLVTYLFSQQDAFRHTYFYILALATLSSPISYLTGINDWKQRYKGAKTSTFVKKSRYGVILILVGAVCTAWYYFYPSILDGYGVSNIVFLALNLSTFPLTVSLGHLGGKLVFMVQR